MPQLSQTDASKLVNSRHPEWIEFQRVWRWLADSLENGERYSHADYFIDPIQDALAITALQLQRWPLMFPNPSRGNGVDPLSGDALGPVYGQYSFRNLIPHLSETGDDGKDLYVMRRSRTPIPRLTERAVGHHVAKIFAKEITRKGPPLVEEWWENVDGRGTTIDEWVQFDVGPLFLVTGFYDVLFDHPAIPSDAQAETRADLRELGLDACVARPISPEFIPWWKLERDGITYREVLIFDQWGANDSGPVYWHWTAEDVRAYRQNGVEVTELGRDHPFGRVPLVRGFDRRLVRTTHTGKSRYAGVADLQKAVYNQRSELALSDVQASHAILQGPDVYVQSGKPIPMGPGNILPMKRLDSGGYAPWSYLDPPKGAQDAIRQHALDYCDEADRDAALAKPAGQTSQSTVSQSGLSKIADQEDGNKILAQVATALQRFERAMAKMALVVLTDGSAKPADLDAIEIGYPRQFDLDSLADVAAALDNLQRGASMAGALPVTEGALLKRAALLALPGIEPELQALILAEIDAFAAEAGRRVESQEPPNVDAGGGVVSGDDDTPPIDGGNPIGEIDDGDPNAEPDRPGAARALAAPR